MGAKAKHDIAPTIRGAFLKGLGIVETRTKKTFSDLMADWIEADGLGPVLQAVSKYTVREQHSSKDVNLNGNVTHNHLTTAIPEIDTRITGLLGDGEIPDSQETITH